MHYVGFVNLQIIASNSLISKHAVSIVFKQTHMLKMSDLDELEELIRQYPKINVFSELKKNDHMNVWGVIGNGYLPNNADSLIDGIFLNKNDALKQSFVAVVGKNILNSDACYLNETKTNYFKFNNKNYEIQGTILPYYNSMLNNTAFVDLVAACEGDDSVIQKIIVDGNDPSDIYAVRDYILQRYDAHEVKENNNFIERYIYNDAALGSLNALVAIFLGLFLIALVMLFLRNYNQEVKIKIVLGISSRIILHDLCKSIFILAITNISFFCIAYLVAYYTFLRGFSSQIYLLYPLAATCVIIAVLVITVFVYVLLSNRLLYRNGVK